MRRFYFAYFAFIALAFAFIGGMFYVSPQIKQQAAQIKTLTEQRDAAVKAVQEQFRDSGLAIIRLNQIYDQAMQQNDKTEKSLRNCLHELREQPKDWGIPEEACPLGACSVRFVPNNKWLDYYWVIGKGRNQ